MQNADKTDPDYEGFALGIIFHSLTDRVPRAS